jgi:alkyl sulfatase BDS1-like metallo-beta-lactamase superfamily hydrolase
MKPWIAAALLACSTPAWAQPASEATAAANAGAAASLPFADAEDEEFAARGFIAAAPEPQIKSASGAVLWDFTAYKDVSGPAPTSVHPSLWRHAKLLTKHGLFKVRDNVWQVRGFDVSNMSIIRSRTGLILIDPLTTAEAARAALALARASIGDLPVKAVIYTHSHVDHFGGVKGVVDEKDAAAGRVQILAPQGFLEHAVGENVIAGAAMSRRAMFQFGAGLAPGPEGTMTSGIGPGVASGSVTLIPPTRAIARTGETVEIDGVVMQFQMTPGTEAPAEMNVYFPQLRALCLAENANVSMHNVLTPRGALVRDAKAWADYLTEALRLYGGLSEVMFTSHGWPRWGQDRVADFIASHRDAYKYLHDQTVRMMNDGMTGVEIAEAIALPPSLANRWFNRGYYGTMNFNAKAVYQRYMGWYDGNPATMRALPPQEASKRYVALMGGRKKTLKAARRAVDAGEHRWAAELLNRLVFADGNDADAKALLADVETQLGYQMESAIGRNIYLSGAKELREGPRPARAVGTLDVIRNTPTPMFFDLLAVRLDPAKAGDAQFSVRFVFPERKENVLVSVRNQVLVHEAGVDGPADATVTLPRAAFLAALLAGAPPKDAKIVGDATLLPRFMGLFSAPDPAFAIVTP